MNISRKDLDAVNAILTVQIQKEDYADKVEKTLRDYRKKANVPGFRPGMVPLGLIKKMYGKGLLAEEINKILSDSLFGYIKENEISILGEPMPNETEQKEINFDTDETFEFAFDIAIAPDMNIALDKKTKIPYYEITVSPEMIEEQVKSYVGRYGNYEQVEKADEKDIIRGSIQESNGKINVEETTICATYIKDENEKKQFLGAKIGDKITFSPQKAYDNNEAEISALLKIKKDQVAELTNDFVFTVKNITRYNEAKIDQTLFDKVFGENTITSEDAFRTRIAEDIQKSLQGNSDYKFALDAKDAILKKNEKVVFPEAFIKRWLLASNKNMTAETLEKDFPKMLEELKWQVISDKIAKADNLKVEQNDITEYAKKMTLAQFAQYGMNNIPDDVVENYAKEMLKKQESVQNLIEKALNDKIIEAIKSKVQLTIKKISIEDFGKLFEK